jgi:lysophospholipase L1-like esterase
MIGGFPHQPENSFFHHALSQLRSATPHQLVPGIYTFGGFPVTRVPKHLKARCLDTHPDIVVLQFASSDLVVPIHREHRTNSNLVHRAVSVQMPTTVDWCRWQLQGLLGDLRRLEPVTPLETYLATMEQIAGTLLEHGITPVVLSPFVFGAARSDRLARAATRQLSAPLSARPGIFYVDAYAALDRFSRRQMLLKDGSHLSLAGHRVVAEALVPHLKNALLSREPKPSPATAPPAVQSSTR